MARRASGTLTSAIDQLATRSRQLLGRLRQEIGTKEAELKGLKGREADLTALAKGHVVARRPSGKKPSRKRGGRIDWNSVLAQLPKTFKASEVRKVRGLK